MSEPSISLPVPLIRRVAVPAGVVSGSLFIALGLAFIVFGQDYRVGNMTSMGPGMFPIAGGWLLVALGGLIVLSYRLDTETIDPIVLRPLVGILASVTSFALLIDQLGLIFAGPVLIGGALVATGQGSLRSGVVLCVALTAASSLTFPTLLGVPLKVLP